MWRIVARVGQMGYPVIIKLGTHSVGPHFIVGKTSLFIASRMWCAEVFNQLQKQQQRGRKREYA